MTAIVHLVVATLLISSSESVVLNETKFGLDEERIVDSSSDETIMAWAKFMVAVALLPAHEAMCSALILSRHWTLTTCTCVVDAEPEKENLVIIAGTTTTNDKKLGQRRTISDLVQHPHCSDKSVYSIWAGNMFDYGLIKVTPELIFDDSVQAIAIASWDQREFEYITNYQLRYEAECVTAGWGETVIEYPNKYSKHSSVLRDTNVRLMKYNFCSQVVCLQIQGAFCLSAVLLTGKVCAKSINGGNPCKSDIGGPLICNNYLIAIVSTINTCGEYSEPNFFARLDLAIPFIKEYYNGIEAFTGGKIVVFSLNLLIIFEINI